LAEGEDPKKAVYILQLRLGADHHTEYLFGYRYCTEPVDRPEPNVSTLVKGHLIVPPEELKLLIGMALCKNWF